MTLRRRYCHPRLEPLEVPDTPDAADLRRAWTEDRAAAYLGRTSAAIKSRRRKLGLVERS